MNKFLKYSLMLIMIFILCACETQQVESKQGVFINEICSNNESSYHTESYDYYDWIELYNSTSEDIYLKKYGLSDDNGDLFKYVLPAITIKSNSYVVIFCDVENSNGDDLVAGFNLSTSGETLYLTMPNGDICDTVKFPSLGVDTSYGSYKGKYEVLNPTPMEKNENKPIYKYVNAPEFSNETGFYSSSFNLTLTSDKDTKIYYTTDSSIPTVDSIEYKNPIQIEDPSKNKNVLKNREDITAYENTYVSPTDKAMIIRAICVSKDGNVSDVVTHSYFIGKNKYKNETVISLVTDSANLIDEDYGIYVKGNTYNDWLENGSNGSAVYNWSNKGREWERECSISYIEEGNNLFTQDCGIRIHGYGGRSSVIKSFNLYARNCYGDKYFKNPIFDGATNTKSLILKYDRYSDSNEKFRDGFVQSLMADTNVTIQEYEKCVVFLNGEYWETYLAMQKYSDDYLLDEYGVEKENAVIIKDGKLEEGNEKDLDEYKELISFVKNTNFSNESNYKRFRKLVDEDSLIDFYITQIFLNNFDYSTKKNYVMWKAKNTEGEGYLDGRWRFMLYDMDVTAAKVSFRMEDNSLFTYDYTFDPFTGDFKYATDFKDDPFVHSLMKNKTFKDKFIKRFMDLCNTRFEKEYVKSRIYSEYGLRSGEMVTFFDNRFEYLSKYFADYLKIENDLRYLTIESKFDYKLNTLSLNENYKGYYYGSMYITLETDKKYSLTDLEVIDTQNGVITLKITGDNPKIIIG